MHIHLKKINTEIHINSHFYAQPNYIGRRPIARIALATDLVTARFIIM